ncbi:hypothetical protein Plo01_00800 [Planobispora longispora]|uniref:Uncharacterized protein n=1 Tax=Planobispora longispora TaxID=28887 RepID=A0A8J3W3B3_9ACTN|nr:hypothetical protein Plo01_00800 [Planobispora longispora]
MPGRIADRAVHPMSDPVVSGRANFSRDMGPRPADGSPGAPAPAGVAVAPGPAAGPAPGFGSGADPTPPVAGFTRVAVPPAGPASCPGS